MYQQVLLIYSDYNFGKRIALHGCYESIEDMYEFFSLTDKIKEIFKHLTFSFHHIQTEGSDFNSVVEYDKYFKDIELFKDIDEFISCVKDDTTIKPLDIAKLILCKKELSPLELEKMVYFSYCEYMKMYKKAMFSDEFEAWDFGPVIPELYQEFKSYGRTKVKIKEEDKIFIYSKIMKFDLYNEIIESIDKSIDLYGKYSAYELVSKSHEKDSPWYKTYRSGMGRNQIISKEMIQEYLEVI